MSLRLQRSFHRLERKTQRLLRSLAVWTPEQLRHRAAPQSWSALDLLDHLILTERAVIATLRRNLSSAHPVILSGRCRSALVLAIMFLPVRVKVPDSVAYLLPSTPPDLTELSRVWKQDRTEMADFLQTLSPSQGKLGLFRHPVGGWTTARGALLFLHLHLHHHLYQLRRLRKAQCSLLAS